MVEDYRCPYCLQRVSDAEESHVVDAADPLAPFIGVDEASPVHADCYVNAADRA
ncbi:hypothetical protein [Halolamina litorea]|uniref:Small CPxCG-related zinc finger protein n=1 Tax=Halolamina litorea TaxID=1515593 RepID=A0ABD6BPP2_9EURY|nr:hypothetical protein [Halolamina litorea]